LDGCEDRLHAWPVCRRLTGDDPFGHGAAVRSAATAQRRRRTSTADWAAASVCPCCAVGCGQRIYVKDEKVVQIEGDPDSPVSRGRLCPKGSASLQLTTGAARRHEVLQRRRHGSEWERLDLATPGRWSPWWNPSARLANRSSNPPRSRYLRSIT
jgi:formate dehydrogenase major subunit